MDYGALNIDFRESALLKYIRRPGEVGSPADDDFYEIDIEYYRPFGIANRQYPAWQKFTIHREAGPYRCRFR